MAAINKHQQEVDRNYDAFRTMLPELVKIHPSRFALLRHRELIACFDTARDAIEAGRMAFDDGIFSIQEISTQPIDLGYFSRAGIVRGV